jgi:hypothetical protein
MKNYLLKLAAGKNIALFLLCELLRQRRARSVAAHGKTCAGVTVVPSKQVGISPTLLM